MLWPSLLLVCIAGRQIWLALTDGLSPWKGGGFGMFAAMDHPGSRFVHCRGTTTEGETVLVRFGALSPSLTRKLYTFPEESDLERLVGVLIQGDYIESAAASEIVRDEFLSFNPHLQDLFPDRPARPVKVLTPRDRRKPGHTGAPGFRLASVEVSVWKSRFQPRERVLRAEIMLGPERAEAAEAPADPAGAAEIHTTPGAIP